ncbi:penicillin-binding protein 1F [Paenibacillus sp. J31TS4]|uniref:transglycosylase domain-containing protein n=1 Tax=Paenibacillus sp. J31TS4 TaxID=2807195 RepID=UPI001B2CF216|nr:PBP1A family penicillin-binding protein [Paenibacillus sp. J31TS4]GIP37334.1 penicillin-binding protein 1F [Paenibacillus sp. J31TS4]
MAEQSTKKKPAKKRRNTGKTVLVGLLIAGAIAIIVGLAGYLAIIYTGQRILTEQADKLELSEPTVLLDAAGNEVTKINNKTPEVVTQQQIPPLLANAFIATEDKRFAEHSGVDLYAIGRALYKDILQRSAAEGGSTITQQLAKNIFLSADKTVFRKATEVSIAIALEQQKSKEEIMTMYLNRIYFGHGDYGVKLASKRLFGVSDLNELKLWQIATLAAMPKAPNTYSPLNNPDKSKERRAVVLTLMQQQGYISEQQAKEAAAVDYVPPKQTESDGTKQRFLTYIDYVMQEASDQYNIEEDKLRRGGYKIYTTMNADAQQAMETAYANSKFFQKDVDEQIMQSSMVITDHRTGGIVAMIGGRDYETKGRNRALDLRQPGSSFKPIISYAPALESGKFGPNSMLKDEKQSYNGYSPRNYDNKYRGEVSMREAIKLSINQPAVWLLNEIGLKRAKQFAEGLGIQFTDEDNNLAIALGGMNRGVSPLQMAQAYGAFANGGVMMKSHAITKIVNASGGTVAAFKEDKGKRVMSEKTAYYMTELMKSVIEPGGTGFSAAMNRPVAGKTGSTQEVMKGLEQYYRDLWFAGYTPEWTGAIWMGFDKPDPKHYVTLKSGAPAALFKEIMTKGLAKVPAKVFPKPAGIEEPKKVVEQIQPVNDLNGEYQEGSRSIKLTWSAVEGSDVLYKVFRKGSKEMSFSPLTELTGTTVNDIAIEPGDTYEYYVESYSPSLDQSGGKSNAVKVTVSLGAATPTPTPSGLVEPSGSPGATDGRPVPSSSIRPTPTPGEGSARPGGPSPSGGSQTERPGQSTPSPTPTAPPASGEPAAGGEGANRPRGL